MKKQLIRISILQSGKIVAALYAILGLLYSLIAIPMLVFGNTQLKIVGFIYLFMPIFLAVFGFIFFVIFAAIYNFLAAKLGGVEIEVLNIE